MAPRCAGGENTEYARRRSARECGVPDQSGQREAEKFGSASKARSFRFYCTEERLRTLLGCDVDDKKYLAEFSLSAAHHNQTERDPPSGVSPAQSPPFLAGEKVHSEENSVMVLSSRDQASETEDDAFENLSVGLEAVEFTGVVPASEDDDSSLASGLLEQPSSDEEDYLDPDYLDEQSLLCEGQPSAGSRKRQKAHPDCEFEQDPPSNPSGRELSLGDFRAGTPSTDGASSGDVRDWILSHSPPNFYPSPGAFTADSRDFVGHRARPAEEETRSNGDRCLFQSSVSAVERDNFFSVEFTGDAAGPWRTTKRAPYSRSGFCGSPRPKPTSHMSATRRSASAAAHHGSCLKAFYPFQQFPDVSFGRSTRPKSHSRGLDFPLFSLLFSNDLQKRQSLPTRWPPAVLDPAQWRSRNREPPDGSQKPCEEEETAAGGPRATVPQEAQDGDVSDKLQLAARRQGVKSGSCVSPHRQLGNQKSARQQSERSEQERIFRGRQDGRYAVSRRKGQEPTEDTTENDRVSQFSLQRGATRDKGEVAQNGAEGRTYELYTRRCALCRTEWICGAEQERVSCERSNAVEENDPADIKSHAGYRKGRRTSVRNITGASGFFFTPKACPAGNMRHVEGTLRSDKGGAASAAALWSQVGGLKEIAEDSRRRTCSLPEKQERRILVGLENEVTTRRFLTVRPPAVVEPRSVISPLHQGNRQPHYKSRTMAPRFREYLLCHRANNPALRSEPAVRGLGNLNHRHGHHPSVDSAPDGGSFVDVAERRACRQRTATEDGTLTSGFWYNVFANHDEDTGNYARIETPDGWLSTPSTDDESTGSWFSVGKDKRDLRLSVAQPQSFADWSFTLTMSQRRETPDGAGSVGEESDQKAYQSHPLYGQSPNKEQNSRIGRSKRRPGQLFAAAVRRSPNAPSCRNSKGGIVGGVQERSRSTDSMTEDGKTAELRRQARRAKESEVEQKRTHEKHDLWQRKSITDTVRTASVETEETCGVPRDDTASYNQKLTKKGTEVVVFCAPMSRNQLSDTTTGHSFSGKKGAFCPAAPSRVISYLGSPLVSKTSSRDRWLLLEAKTEIGERRASQLTGCLLRDEDTGKAGGREGQNVGCCEGARTRILATLYRGRERQSEAADLTCGGGPPEIAPSGCVRSETGLQCIGKSGHLRESTEEGGPQTRAAKEIEHDDRGDMRGPKRSGFPCLSERLLVPIRGRQQTSLAERGREGVFERGAEAYVGSESRPAKRLQEQLARKTGVQVVTGCEKKGQLANSLHSPDERIESSSSPGGRMVQLRQHRKKGEGAVVSESQGREEGPPCLLGCKNEAWDRERKTHAQKGTRDHVNPQHEAQRTHAQEGEGLKQRRTLQQKLLREVTAAQASCSEAPLKWRQPEQEKNVTHSVKNTTYIHSEKHPRHTIQKKREKALKKITPDHVENRAEKEKELHRPGETGTHWRAEGENPGVESSANEHEAFEQFSSPSSAGLVGSARPLAKGGMAVSQTRGHLDATCRRKRYARRRQGTAFQSRGIHSCVGTESTEDCQPVMPPSSLARSGIFRRISRTSFRASRRDPVVTGIMATSVPEGLTSGKGTGAWLSVWHWTVWSAMIVLQWSWWRVNAVSI